MHRITDNGDVRVQFPGKPEQQFRWTVNPAALTKVRMEAESSFIQQTILAQIRDFHAHILFKLAYLFVQY